MAVDPIRIFVGCAPNGEDAESQAVLEYTLRKHATRPLAITWMKQSRDPASPFYGFKTQTWSTPFSGFRWLVPSLCGFEGRAIYLDSDMIVRSDIAGLYDQRLAPGKIVLAKGGAHSWRFCVSVWDCAAARPHLPAPADLKASTAHTLMIGRLRNSNLVQPFDGHWNVIDGEDFADIEDPAINIIHYSAEDRQPHLRYAIPRLDLIGRKHWFDGKVKAHWREDLVALFDRMLEEAIAAGLHPYKYVPEVPFGAYPLQSHKNYTSQPWAR